MKTSLDIEFGGTYVLISILVALVFSVVLYFKTNTEIKKGLKLFLALFRFLAVGILCFLLLEPYVEYNTEKSISPKVVLLVDNSESIKLSNDSLKVKELISTIKNNLSNEVELIEIGFGKALLSKDTVFGFTTAETNITSSLNDLNGLYENNNVNQVVLISDGIQNSGSADLIKYTSLNKIISIGVGDTSTKKDLLVKKVFHNSLSYKGNEFPLEIEMLANNLKGEEYTLKLFYDDSLVKKWIRKIPSNNHFESFQEIIKSNKSGFKKIAVKAIPLKSETSTENNSKESYIKIIEERKDILILYDGVHPDVAAFKSVFRQNSNYKLTSMSYKDWDQNIKLSDLTVLFSLPNSTKKNKEIKDKIIKGEGNTLLFLQNNTPYKQLTGVNFNKAFDEAAWKLNPNFELFNLPNSFNSFEKASPLSVPFNLEVFKGQKDVLAYQKIGRVKTEKPLIYFLSKNGKRIGVIGGEGIWRWQMTNGGEGKEAFSELMEKVVSLLASPVDKSNLQINFQEKIKENESLIINAEFRNETNELSNLDDLQLRLIDKEDNTHTYVFSKTSNSYRLVLKGLEPGVYKMEYGFLNKDRVESRKILIVEEYKLEAQNLKANHTFLQGLSTVNNGKFFNADESDKMIGEVNSFSFKELTYSIDEYKELIRIRVIFFILIVLLTVEWGLRKRKNLA